jgi:hypothetical protein
VSERLRILSVSALALAAALLADSAAAQDYDAGKTGPQLFASDCAACHKSAGGLAKGKDKGSLTSFLREHYTSKQESAQLLAAYLLGAGPGDAKPDRGDAPGGPKAKPRRSEREEEPKGEPKPEPKPRAEPARRAEEPAENREEAPKRARAEEREAPKGEAAAVLSKLRNYGASRGPAKDTARLASPQRRLETYANSGSNTVTPGTHDDAAAKRKPAPRKKKKDTDAAATTPGEHAPRPPKPPQRATGTN